MWSFDLAAWRASACELAATLSHPERRRAASFARRRDAEAFAVRRGLLRRVLGSILGVAPGDVELDAAERRRPRRLDGGPAFSTSSCARSALVCVSHDTVVGVDVEDRSGAAAAQRVVEAVTGRRVGGDEALRRWTAAEALAKATGVRLHEHVHGLLGAPPQARAPGGRTVAHGGWAVVDAAAHPDEIAALAVPAGPLTVAWRARPGTTHAPI